MVGIDLLSMSGHGVESHRLDLVTADLTEAVVHGTLHLCGHDHETDDGEMLALQARVMAALGEAAPG